MTGVKRLNRRRLDGARVGAGIEACPRARRVRGKIYGRIRGPVAPGTILNATGQQLYFQRGGYVVNTEGTTLALGEEAMGASVTTITSAAARGNTTIPIAAASIAPGFYWLGARTISNGTTTRDAGGELIEVTASASNSATLSRPLIRPHLSGATVRPMTRVNRDVIVSGFKGYGVRAIVGTPPFFTENHLYFGGILGLTVMDCDTSSSTFQSVYTQRCSDVTIRNIRVADTPVGIPGLGYAVGPSMTVRMNISNIHASASRHCVSLAGSCAEVTVNQISASSDCSFVFDDHDGCQFITLRGAFAPQLAPNSSAVGVGIQLGNASWTWEGTDYTVEDCAADWIELRTRRIGHTFTRCDARYMVIVGGANTANGFTQRFQQITFQNGALTGRSTDSTVQVGPAGGGTTVEIDRILFLNSTLTAGAIARHLITVAPTQGTWTSYSMRIEGCAISGNSPVAQGALIVRQVGSAALAAQLRLDITGTTITPATGGANTTTPLFARPSAMTNEATHAFACFVAPSATFGGTAIASGNVTNATRNVTFTVL